MRQVVLDTETTGLEVELDHRVIEIGCVEIFNRRVTGRNFHRYLNPERDIDEGAIEVHGLTRERLQKEATFAEIRAEFLEFVHGAELLIHNAAFDVAFLNAELGRRAASIERGAASIARIEDLCRVLDTLALARQMHPGQRNSLDALCKRYSVDNSRRDYHGALLDARLLADVYLTMTGGQAALILSEEPDASLARSRHESAGGASAGIPLVVISANDEELDAHEQVLALLDGASSGKTVWRTL
jgi:DNA polymerase-3 subunit epsilon